MSTKHQHSMNSLGNDAVLLNRDMLREGPEDVFRGILARGWSTDTDAQTEKRIGLQRGCNGEDAFVSGCASALLESEATRRQVKFVMNNEDLIQ